MRVDLPTSIVAPVQNLILRAGRRSLNPTGKSSVIRWWGFLALLFFCVPSASAQVSANISGQVNDQSGAAIQSATVTARNVDTGIVRTTTSDDQGVYEIFSLPLGPYEMRANKSGFSEVLRTGVRLVVGEDAKINFNLTVGPVTSQVKIVEPAPMVSVTTTDISGLVGEQQVKDLPLNGRSFDLLMPLNPGVVNFTLEKTGGTGVSNSTNGNNFAVSGNRPQQNLFLLNGVEYTGAAENNMQPGGTSGELLGVDAVREFNVLRDSYGAEYGKHPGAQVVIVTQSGTNQWHGSAYEFLRNNDLDSRNYLRHRIGAAGFPAQSVRSLHGRADPEGQDICLRELRRIPAEPASDVRNFRAGERTRAAARLSPLGSSCPAAQQAACALRGAAAAEPLAAAPIGPELTAAERQLPAALRRCSTARCKRFARISARRALDHIFSAKDSLSAVYTIDDGARQHRHGVRSVQHGHRQSARTGAEPGGDARLFADAAEYGAVRLFPRGLLFPGRADAGHAGGRRHQLCRQLARWAR